MENEKCETLRNIYVTRIFITFQSRSLFSLYAINPVLLLNIYIIQIK